MQNTTASNGTRAIFKLNEFCNDIFLEKHWTYCKLTKEDKEAWIPPTKLVDGDEFQQSKAALPK